jgi:PAS domain S-box-containing protein
LGTLTGVDEVRWPPRHFVHAIITGLLPFGHPAHPAGLPMHATLPETETLFARAPVPLWVVDAGTGEVLDVNEAACRTFGYTRSRFLDLGPRQIGPLPPANGQAAVRRLPRGDGSEIHAELAAERVEVEGRPAWLVSAHDVTTLLDANRMEPVGRLAGGVAHDFNNLLTAITGYTDMLLSDVEPGGEMHADLMEIRKAAARATGLTRQLLAFSRRQVLQPRVLNLNATIRGTESTFRRLLGDDVRLEVELDPAAEQVRADPAQVEQVLLNLAVNARDAMPAGGTLRITTHTAVVGASDGPCALPANLKQGRYVVVSASDTGEGIAPEVLPQIFEPFFTTRPAGLGTGLGLATVYGIIKQSGGTVWAESEPGRGATFHVYLPATDELPGAVAALPARTPAAATGTVLLVDDDAAVRTFVRTVLSGAGYRVMDAADGAQALHLAAECGGALDLLVTDVVMPRMGGRALADEVASRWPGLPTLFMSGYTDDALADHGVLDPAVMLLEKPFSREALLDHVREALARGAVVCAG